MEGLVCVYEMQDVLHVKLLKVLILCSGILHIHSNGLRYILRIHRKMILSPQKGIFERKHPLA